MGLSVHGIGGHRPIHAEDDERKSRRHLADAGGQGQRPAKLPGARGERRRREGNHALRRHAAPLCHLLKKDVDGESPIYYAVRLGLFEAAEKLLALRSTGIKNLLHYFVAEDKLEIVKRVHSWNKKLFEAVDPEGKNALHFAALCADLRMCQWLIEKGLDPKSLSVEKMSVLHHAVLNSRHGKELVPFFASLNVDVNGEMEKGETPLHGALFAENLDVARTLLRLGAKLNKSKNNILIFCVMANKLKSAQFVHRRSNSLVKNYVDSKGQTALHVAAACADEKMCAWLVRVGVGAESPESTVLHKVGYNTNHGTKLTPFFVNMGLDLNERDESGKTPIVHALRAGNLAVAETMLGLGADLEIKVGGFNLVHLFLICNNMKAVRYLHRKNKSMVQEILSPQRTNAMHLVATFGDLAMCSWLCKIGFDARDIASHFRNSVLHFATLNRQFGKLLVPFFVYKGVDVNQRNAISMTPLHFALQKENFEVAEALLKSGADSKVKIERDNLLIFCIRKKLRRSAEFVVEKFAEQILEAGAEGQTALHVAARLADLEFFRFLIREDESNNYSCRTSKTKNGLHTDSQGEDDNTKEREDLHRREPTKFSLSCFCFSVVFFLFGVVVYLLAFALMVILETTGFL
ncbi:Hypothetical predicted protein [Cloeon dipterum]|uniref:Uncharacterized protein n=1 Tax=Cloeon dipterum TaxID=197152 RepID=A0A8S1E1D6_9INSE|nr:Hypothetical predicted protein [Cloeon dipterum]